MRHELEKGSRKEGSRQPSAQSGPQTPQTGAVRPDQNSIKITELGIFPFLSFHLAVVVLLLVVSWRSRDTITKVITPISGRVSESIYDVLREKLAEFFW